jgi:hypothetical protein
MKMNIDQLPHKVLDYSCPINALEDQYEWHTGTRLPGFFLMDVSTIGFLYIKQKMAPAPRMVFWGTGMGKPIHTFLSDIIGYQWQMHEGGSFQQAWNAVANQIRQGKTAMIGLLDMYHLPYFEKFYHRFHIPQHFVHVIGYDEQSDSAIILDNSLPDKQFVPLSDLQNAWNVSVPGQGKPYTYYFLTFNEQTAAPQQIAEQGLKKCAHNFLNPPNSRLGSKALQKIALEIPNWSHELSEKEFKTSLQSLATFTCSVVPNLPQRLLPYPLGYIDPHQACRDRFAKELLTLSDEYGKAHWKQAAEFFAESGAKIGELTDLTTQVLLQGNPDLFTQAAHLFAEISRLESQAFSTLY